MVKRSPSASSQFSFTAFVPSFHGDPEQHNWDDAKSSGPNTVPWHPQQAKSGNHGKGQIKY